jgi:hypothetical protein
MAVVAAKTTDGPGELPEPRVAPFEAQETTSTPDGPSAAEDDP